MRHTIDLHRRQLLAGGIALTAAAWLVPLAHAVEASKDGRSRLVMLGTAGGPTPKALRAAPAQALPPQKSTR